LKLKHQVVVEDIEQRISRLPEHAVGSVSEEIVGKVMEKECEELASRFGRSSAKILENTCESLLEEHDDMLAIALVSGSKLVNGASLAGRFCRSSTSFCQKGEL
jgi:hypothetical protein